MKVTAMAQTKLNSTELSNYDWVLHLTAFYYYIHYKHLELKTVRELKNNALKVIYADGSYQQLMPGENSSDQILYVADEDAYQHCLEKFM